MATPQSFDRGFNYFRGGAIFEAVCQGNQLRAYCHGSHYEPYRVSATFGQGGGLTDAYCSCPYNWGGICKHIVALLLSWIHEPEVFHTLAPLDEILTNRSKEDLIALVKEMLQREPDLLRLLDLPLPSDDQRALDLDAFRRQIDFALRHDFPDAEALGNELGAIIETAIRFLDAGDWASAGALFRLILVEIVPDYQDLYDEEGNVAFQLSRCAAGLADCFSQGSPGTETRRAWLETLLEAEFKDIEIGGVDLAHPAGELVISQATGQEWSWIEARVRQEIAAHSAPYSQWGRERLVHFLVRRLELTEREAESADLIFELGSPEQQAFLLVRLGRFGEATALAEKAFASLPGLVESFADALVEAGAGPAAAQFIMGLLDTHHGASYLSWLAEYAEQQDDLLAALGWWRQLFQVSPRLDIYHKLQDVSTRLDTWHDLRPKLLLELADEERWGLLIEIALDENDVAWALQLLAGHEEWYGQSHRLQVAEAAEQDYPQAARSIYLEMSETLIGFRGRSNYQMAAELLVRTRSLYARQKEHAEWKEYIAKLRDRHRRLPALKDELNRAGL